MDKLPFNRPFMVGKELFYIAQSVLSGHISGDGPFTRKVGALLQELLPAHRVLLTTSCTSALEMSAILCGAEPGTEVVMPSFTFVSTANAFYLRGARPRFVDIRRDTLNIDESLIDAAITPNTIALVPVHYAGVASAMEEILAIAARHGLMVVEDAAQGMCSFHRGRHLGTIGDLGCLSFHETKNVICGEGGALVINRPDLVERAEIVREKGTDRSRFLRGEVEKYSWVDVGSSHLPSDILAAFLYAQLEQLEQITARRRSSFDAYMDLLGEPSSKYGFKIPDKAVFAEANGHLFYLLLDSGKTRDALLAHLNAHGVHAVFHYVPLHTSPVGRKLGYAAGDLPVTEEISSRLLRLPMYHDLTVDDQRFVARQVVAFYEKGRAGVGA